MVTALQTVSTTLNSIYVPVVTDLFTARAAADAEAKQRNIAKEFLMTNYKMLSIVRRTLKLKFIAIDIGAPLTYVSRIENGIITGIPTDVIVRTLSVYAKLEEHDNGLTRSLDLCKASG